jgi:hypothetical protein
MTGETATLPPTAPTAHAPTRPAAATDLHTGVGAAVAPPPANRPAPRPRAAESSDSRDQVANKASTPAQSLDEDKPQPEKNTQVKKQIDKVGLREVLGATGDVGKAAAKTVGVDTDKLAADLQDKMAKLAADNKAIGALAEGVGLAKRFGVAPVLVGGAAALGVGVAAAGVSVAAGVVAAPFYGAYKGIKALKDHMTKPTPKPGDSKPVAVDSKESPASTPTPAPSSAPAATPEAKPTPSLSSAARATSMLRSAPTPAPSAPAPAPEPSAPAMPGAGSKDLTSEDVLQKRSTLGFRFGCSDDPDGKIEYASSVDKASIEQAKELAIKGGCSEDLDTVGPAPAHMATSGAPTSPDPAASSTSSSSSSMTPSLRM